MWRSTWAAGHLSMVASITSIWTPGAEPGQVGMARQQAAAALVASLPTNQQGVATWPVAARLAIDRSHMRNTPDAAVRQAVFGFAADEQLADPDSALSRVGRASPGVLRRATVLPMLRYNRVEAVRFGLRLVDAEVGPVSLDAETGWSSARHAMDGVVRASVPLSRASRLRAVLRAGIETEMRLRSLHYRWTLPSLATLFGWTDYHDYYRRDGFSLAVARFAQSPRDLHGNVSLYLEDHRSLPGATSYDVLGRDTRQRHNPRIDEGRYAGIRAALLAGGAERLWGPLRSVRVDLEVARSAEGHAISFGRGRLLIDVAASTLYRQTHREGLLRVRLVAASFTGKLPVQRFASLDGRLLGYQPFGVIRSLSGRPYEGERSAGLFWQQDLGSLPFRLVGLRSLARAGMGIGVFGGHGSTYVTRPTRRRIDFSARPTGGVHHEIGISLTDVFGFPIRVDLTRRLDRRDFTVGFGVCRNW